MLPFTTGTRNNQRLKGHISSKVDNIHDITTKDKR